MSKSANFKMEPATNLGGGLSIAVTKERVILISKPLQVDTAIETPLNLDQVIKLRDKLDKIIFDAQPEKMQQVDSREEINRVLDDYAKGNVLHFAMVGIREDGSGLVISESPATLVKQMLEDGADAIEKSLSGSSVKH